MAIRLPDGSIQMKDGRILYANCLLLAQDLIELLPLFTPPPAWPFVSGGGGGGGGGNGTPGARGADGAPGVAGLQGPQGTNPGVQGSQGGFGSQGNQGVSGAGAQGAQGNQGSGGAGSQGPQGNLGAQGFQGSGGAGAQGNQGAQGATGSLANDIFASDRVVSLVPGEGTDLTLAAALAALPADGGTIYVKAGVYPIAATMTLPLKNVVIIGAGSNGGLNADPNATIFDLSANAIFLFNTPAGGGGTVFGSYVFKNFQVLGTALAGQGFLNSPPGTLGTSVLCESLNINEVQTCFQSVNQDWTVTVRDSSLRPRTATASFWRASGPGGEFNWDNVQATLPVSGTPDAITGGPTWNVSYSYVGGGGSPSLYTLQDIEWVGFFFGRNLDRATVTINAAISTIVSCHFQGVSLIVNTTLFFCSNSWFSGSSLGTNAQIVCNGVAGTGDMAFSNVNFDASGAIATIGLDLVDVENIVISGCQFEGHSTAGIRASGDTTVSVTGCRFDETVPVQETVATVDGKYAFNDDFTGSIIVGTISMVDGRRVRTVTANATLNEDDETVLVDATAGPVTITLPLATAIPFKIYNIKKIDATANAVTIDGNGAQTIDGALTQVITTQYESLSPESDNVSAWWIV